ncbi:hypothetical protein RM190_06460 [Paracoccus sp. CPCC 101403]|uniref:Uncharacterized protein n=2 Tax=Paracoccus broussonetiae TaxID=3075834 RepID=A0ABU3EBA0_9RHOB|nr:hypothetical protein [Paracoccus sp. CPCC 101403]MDT1061496.1 hypothetical protein [Paracoccus sp. CPCC 101403]
MFFLPFIKGEPSRLSSDDTASHFRLALVPKRGEHRTGSEATPLKCG